MSLFIKVCFDPDMTFLVDPQDQIPTSLDNFKFEPYVKGSTTYKYSVILTKINRYLLFLMPYFLILGY